MQDNGERIYAGLMGQEEMQKLEEENRPPQETDFRRESSNCKLPELLEILLRASKGA